MPTRMTAVDAQFYWMSAKVPSDEFLLYAFDGEPTDFERAVDEVRNRAQNCRALTLRVEDGSPLTYPRWVSTVIEQDQALLHHLDDASWSGCLDAVARLAEDQLDIRRASWRMHLFAPVHGIPGSTHPATIAVMQFAHALSDGPRALAMAAWLSGGATPVPELPTVVGLLTVARHRCGASPSQAGARYPRRAAAAGDRSAAGAVHQCPPDGRTLTALAAAASLAAERPHRHRRSPGRGFWCALRPPGRGGRVHGGRGDDGQNRCAACS